MDKKWMIVYIGAIVLLPFLLLVLMRLESPSEILSPPGFYGQNAEIQKAFEASIADKSDVELKYPTSGEYRSAFVLYDIDADGEEEALVFYSLKSEESTVRVNILDKVDNEWKSVYDEVGYGSEIISIEFNDFNGDGKEEFIICWSLYQAKTSKVMTVHTTRIIKNNVFEVSVLVNQVYSFMDIVDMDSDDYDEILVVWQDTTEPNLQKSYASLFKMQKDGNMTQMGQKVVLDASISAYESLKLEKIDDGIAVAYIDAYKGENSMITEVVWWDANKQQLVAPCLDSATLTNTSTFRSPAIPSTDIDGDGKIEIPVIKQLPDKEEGVKGKETQIVMTTWSRITPNGLVPKSYSFVNDTLMYAFMVPEQFKNSLLVYKHTETGVATYYSTLDGVTRDAPLFTLSVKHSSDDKDIGEFSFSVTKDDMVLYGTLTNAGKDFGLTNKKIEDNIIFFK
ncbi:MAG: hypothetical protein GX241_02780 [Ruminococcaceae bacterium]|nr:hypothetical protein [Oscillospiraceae bacterium]